MIVGVYVAAAVSILLGYTLIALLLRNITRKRRKDQECVMGFIMLVILATCFLTFLVLWCTLNPAEYNTYTNAWHAARKESELDWKAHEILEMQRRAHVNRIKDALRDLH